MKYRLVAQVLALAFVGVAQAAGLLVFDREGCAFCVRFEAEVGAIDAKNDEGKRAPLDRIDIYVASPAVLQTLDDGAFTPTFVLMDEGREKGRIRRYPGDDAFWSLLDGKLNQA